nr:hypothetical protein Iba_chr08cCG13930 [Ipomoea batatas]GMD27652.1 hypothetical protein Iba_chr08dCG15730 [Ipomoea batatas]
MMKVNQKGGLPNTCQPQLNGQMCSILHSLIMPITVMQTCSHSISFVNQKDCQQSDFDLIVGRQAKLTI